MDRPPQLDEKAAAAYARRLSELEKKIVLLCSKRTSWGYSRLAHKLRSTYVEVQKAGLRLQARNLAYVTPVSLGGAFNGSAIFLNERGEQVRLAIEAANQATKLSDEVSSRR